jgi:hypothetical protein
MPRKQRNEEDWTYHLDDIVEAKPKQPAPDTTALEAAPDSTLEEVEADDPKFAAYWDGLGPKTIERMVATSAEMDRTRGFFETPASTIVRRRAVRKRLQWFWRLREEARRERDRAMATALVGWLGSTTEERKASRLLAEALERRDGRGVLELSRELPWSASLLGCEAASQVRALGDLEGAYWLLCKHSSHARILPDDPLPIPPREARGGVVSLRGDRWSGYEAYTRVPEVKAFDWDLYDDVIGLGTTITHEILDAFGVPKWKQHIVEVHRGQYAPVGGRLPRARGRVAIVDDVHEGDTSLCVARLYQGDVVNAVEPGFTPLCTNLYPAPQPVASIECTYVEELIEQRHRADSDD